MRHPEVSINNLDHLISQCVWETEFDNEETASFLQDTLSQWSHLQMTEIAEEVLSANCPENEVWRLDKLCVDLGSIDYTELQQELPGRFKIGLQRAVREALGQRAASSIRQHAATRELDLAALQELLGEFLGTGSLPWWVRGRASHIEALEQIIVLAPDYLQMLLRKYGQKQQVRERMVLQWEESHIRQVIRILEPNHHVYILHFADNLCSQQFRKSVEVSREPSFGRNRWLWILNHLLVERGSFFNTVSFVESTLSKMASHYNLNYSELLETCFRASTELAHGGSEMPDFIKALKILSRESGKGKTNTDGTFRKAQDRWLLLQKGLAQREQMVVLGGQKISFSELCAILLREDSSRLLKVLRVNRMPGLGAFLADNLKGATRISVLELSVSQGSQIVLALIQALRKCPAYGSQDREEAAWKSSLSYIMDGSSESFDCKEYITQVVDRQINAGNMLRRRVDKSELLLLLALRLDAATDSGYVPLRDIVQELRCELRCEEMVPVESTSVVGQVNNPSILRRHGHFLRKESSPQGFALTDQLIERGKIRRGKKLQYQSTNRQLLSVSLHRSSDSDGLRHRFPKKFERRSALNGRATASSRLTHNQTGLLSNALLNYLVSGMVSESPIAGSEQGRRRALQLFLLGSPAGLGVVQDSTVRIRIGEENFAIRLLELVGLAGFPRLLRLLDRAAADFALTLMADMFDLRSNGLLPSMNRVDFNFDLHRLLLQALLLGRSRFSITRFMDDFSKLLMGLSSVSMTTFVADLKKSNNSLSAGRADSVLSGWINRCPIEDGELAEDHLILSSLVPHQLRLDAGQRKQIVSALLEGARITNTASADLDEEIIDENDLVRKFMRDDPEAFRDVVLNLTWDQQTLFRFSRLANAGDLLDTIRSLQSAHGVDLQMLKQFLLAISQLKISGISAIEIQIMLTEKIISLWCRGDWKMNSARAVLDEFMNFMTSQNYVSLQEVNTAMLKIRERLPESSIEALARLMSDATGNLAFPSKTSSFATPSPVQRPSLEIQKEAHVNFPAPGQSLQVGNAGLVLLSSFISSYFERLGLVEGGRFLSGEAQRSATLHLQYLATGLTDTEEQYLLLNKLFCGLPMSQSLPRNISLSESEKALAESLITSVIEHWKAIGHSSIEGFRGNWLMRDGVLLRQDEAWSLIVEKRSYDVLLQRSPFSFSVTKLPWMEEAIYTTWVS